MKHISLGGLDVSRIGLGTMAMSGYYLDPTSSDAESIRTIQRALELGVSHIDTAEIYGPFANEELVGRAIQGRRDDVVWQPSSASSPMPAPAPECSTAARRTSAVRSRAP
jgi:aryl-alcohol dehydrogenase-like predicted oxidoreductase